MDAHALLTSQGWRGTGHSLHATTDTIGLAKPLLLNRRDGNKGLGTKAHFTSDQWWMNAFDEQLQGLQQAKTTDGSVGVVQTVKSGRIGGIEKGMGGRWQLGGNFVRGGLLQGTLDMLLEQQQQASSDESSTTEGDKSTGVSTPVEKETQEERARRKMEKIARRAEKEARRNRKAEEKKAKEARKKSAASGVVVKEVSSREGSTEKKRNETKEERRARKEAKRLRREARAAKKA